VGERHEGGEDCADGLAQDLAYGRRLRRWAGRRGEEALGIDGGGAGSAQLQRAEYLDQAHGLPLRADRDEGRELAGETRVSTDDLARAGGRGPQSAAHGEISEN